jgi:ribose transport system substrate-binding protein
LSLGTTSLSIRSNSGPGWPGGRRGPFQAGKTGKKSFKVAVIPKALTHEFWKSIHAGAIKASRDLKAEGVLVEVIWKGPIREDDREQQVQVVEGFTSQGVSGIVLAPLDDKALVRPVEDAKRLGIPPSSSTPTSPRSRS